MMTRIYSELIKFETFKERFEYVSLNGNVADTTFGGSRYLNQIFYKTKEWKDLRNLIIIRDNGCDLALPNRPIIGPIYIHHLNPITKNDILNRDPIIVNPENLICVSFDTHQAIHYGDFSLIDDDMVIRRANDTCPWKVSK